MTVIIDGTNGITDVDGSAAAPALTGTDTNTGIFFPAADTIAFSEGGTEAMRIDSSGNVGIGTTTLNGKLNVLTATDSKLIFNDGSTTGNVRLEAVNNAYSAYKPFEVNASVQIFATGGAERMRIDAAGVITSGLGGMQVISGTSVTASGTAVNFTGIPSWVKRIIVQFVGVSGSGVSAPTLRLGTSGGIEATGYLGSTQNGSSAVLLSTGFEWDGNLRTAARTYHGALTLTLQNSSTNTWVATSMVGLSDGASVGIMGGSKSTSGVVTQLRITFANGTDTFDAGSINILYE